MDFVVGESQGHSPQKKTRWEAWNRIVVPGQEQATCKRIMVTNVERERLKYGDRTRMW